MGVASTGDEEAMECEPGKTVSEEKIKCEGSCAEEGVVNGSDSMRTCNTADVEMTDAEEKGSDTVEGGMAYAGERCVADAGEKEVADRGARGVADAEVQDVVDAGKREVADPEEKVETEGGRAETEMRGQREDAVESKVKVESGTEMMDSSEGNKITEQEVRAEGADVKVEEGREERGEDGGGRGEDREDGGGRGEDRGEDGRSRREERGEDGGGRGEERGEDGGGERVVAAAGGREGHQEVVMVDVEEEEGEEEESGQNMLSSLVYSLGLNEIETKQIISLWHNRMVVPPLDPSHLSAELAKRAHFFRQEHRSFEAETQKALLREAQVSNYHSHSHRCRNEARVDVHAVVQGIAS